ncbi:MAG TPA: Coq4 family protein [Caulobacteraceae bacterium]
MNPGASAKRPLNRSWKRQKVPRDWGHAYNALRKWMADKEDTTQVFEIIRALTGRATLDNYLHLLAQPDGGRLAYEHVELARKLMDRAWVESFAPGTVGATYAEFTSREHLSADGLVQISDVRHEGPDPLDWYGRRIRDVHDLWHVLTGYNRDLLGEVCLVAFTFAQTHGLGWAFISGGIALRSGNKQARQAIWQAYRRGCGSAWLPGEDYERLMAEPLEAARERLNLGRCPIYEAVPLEVRNDPTFSHPSPHIYAGLPPAQGVAA